MATSARDVPLTLSVKTIGAETVGELQAEVRQLGKEGAAAAPAFQALSNEVAKLGDQADLVTSAKGLVREIEDLSVASDKAATTSRELRSRMSELSDETERLRVIERAAKDEVLGAQRALFDKRQALAVLKNETSAADKETSSYTQKVKALNAEIITSKTNLRNLSESYRAAKGDASEAAAAETQHAKTLREASSAAAASKKALDDRNDALARAKVALRDSALATEDIIEAEAKVLRSYGESVAAVDRLRAARQKALDADKAAAREEERLAAIQLNSRRALEAQAKNEADGVVRDYARVTAASKAAAVAAQQSSKAMADAFGTIGTRSVADLQAEIVKVRNALELIKSSGTLVGKELDGAFAAGQRRVKELEREIRAATGQTTLFDRAATGLKSTFGQFAAGFAITEVVQRLGTAFLTANVQLERLRLGLGTIYKNSTTAGTQIDFLRKSANAAGVSMSSISDSFVKFAASTTSANIPIEQTNALFAAITRASGTLGLSGDKVNHMLDALAQMAGKGVVSMEELRQQLGDSLPGALSLTAKGLGITDRELIKLVESGGLLARDLFPALTRSLKDLGGEVNTGIATWERFKNMLSETSQNIGDTGVWDALKYTLATTGVLINSVVNGFALIGDGVVTMGRVMLSTMTGEFAEAERHFETFIERQARAGEKLQENAKLLYGLGGGAEAAATAIDGVAQASTKGAAAQQASNTQLSAGADAHRQVSVAANSNATSTAAAGAATAAAGQAAEVAGQSWQRLSIDLRANNDASDQAILNAEKLVRAKEIEGQASITLAQLTGNERLVLEASAFATLNRAQVMRDEVALRQQQITQVQQYVVGLQAEAERLGDPDGSRAKYIAEQLKSIEAKQAELEKSEQQLAQLNAESDARVAARAAYEDHAEAVGALREALELARETERQVSAAAKEGWQTREQAADASRRAALAENLYRDAMNDATAAAARATQAIRDKNTVSQASASLDLVRSRASEASARALGNETQVVMEQIAQKRIEITTTRAAADAKAAEARAIADATTQQIEHLRSTGELTPAKEAELQSRLENAKALGIEAQATRESIRLLEQEIDALRRNAIERMNNANSKGGGGGGGGGNGGRAAAPANNKYSSPLGTNKYARAGNPSTYGNTREERLAGQGAVDNTLQYELQQKMRAGLLTAEDLPQLLAVAKAIRNNQAMYDRLPGTASSLEALADDRRQMALATQFEQQAAKFGGSGGVPVNVNVSVGGKTTSKTINTSSQEDSDALVDLLKGLEGASKRANK
jgi:tape measure domain-containing protein